MLDLNPDLICRDEECDRPEIHARHEIASTFAAARPHHRPNAASTPLWKRDDPEGMMNAVANACSTAHPTHFSAIVRDVRDDYGSCSERTVYRYLAKLVHQGQLIKLDLGLAFAAYIRPKSRLLGDPEAMREYMLSVVECHPATKDG